MCQTKRATVSHRTASCLYMQGDSRGEVNIVGGDAIGRCEKKAHMNVCLILNG